MQSETTGRLEPVRIPEAELSAGDALIVPAHSVHQVQTVGEGEAEWLLAAPSGVRFLFVDGREASPSWVQ